MSRLVLAAITLVFVGAALRTAVLITDRQEALSRISRRDASRLAAQAESEHHRLQRAVAAFLLPGSSVTRDEVQFRLEALAARASALGGPQFDDAVRLDPELGPIVRDLAFTAEAAAPLVATLGFGTRDIATLGEAADSGGLLRLLGALDEPLARLGATADARAADLVARDQRELGRLHGVYYGIVAGLVFCGLGLMTMMLWHNRLLRQAHARMHALAVDLTRASAKLEDANGAAGRAIAGLHVQNERFDAALNNMSQGLCMVDGANRLIVGNHRYLAMFGLTGAAPPGTPLGEVWRAAVAAGRYPPELLGLIAERQTALAREGRADVFLREHPLGPALMVTHQPMADGGWTATYEDATERRRVEARVAHMAHHDALTDLPNRVLLHERLREALLRLEQREDPALAVLCLDLDHFKDVNDTLGHPAGDALLRVVAERLRGCVRQNDLVARLGGDEFALLQCGGDQPRDAAALAGRVVAALDAPFDLDGHHVRVGASVGIAVAPADGSDAHGLLRRADMALYRAKAEGRGSHRFFEGAMDAQLHARRKTQSDLQEALERGQFELFYQPIFDLARNRTRGFEALLRWHHPVRGMVPPGEFIPLAEEAGLIIPIGRWVVQQACADAISWPADHRVAVNLSPVQFGSPDLAAVVADALGQAGLAPDRLELEITETVLLRDTDFVLGTLHRLRGLGVRIALDDFGIGYSSLSYLRSFPFDKIKIDQSFVRDMGSRADCAAIVESVAQLATCLGMGATAEGVETREQLRRVQAAGCTEAQGYHFGRPLPARELFARPVAMTALPLNAA